MTLLASACWNRTYISESGRARTDTVPRVALPPRRQLVRGLIIVAVAALGFVAFRSVQAVLAARAGRADLEHAATALRYQHLDRARADLVSADHHFHEATSALDGMGPFLWVGRHIPLVRVQIRGTQTMSDIGVLLSRAGLHLTSAAQSVLDTSDGKSQTLAGSVDRMKTVDAALGEAVVVLSTARDRVATLDGYRLIGPLDSNRDELETRLVSSEREASKAQAAVRLLRWLVGESGSRRLLVFSQNPDEVRPTGGYTGTYGVIASRRGHINLLNYSAMGPWVDGHPNAVIPAKDAPVALRYATPPQPQELANVNDTPDWPSAARLAMSLWKRGGERPVDGVMSLMPQTLARIVRVLGPVHMPSYDEVVKSSNLVRRLNYYTHREAVRSQNAAIRKQFIVDLAHEVVSRLLHAPTSKWLSLGRAMSASFDTGEAMIWAPDPSLQASLRTLGWSGAFPNTVGDFYADAEFEYIAKNGDALHRTFDHVVRLHADGSGLSETTMTLRNTADYQRDYNVDSLSYITPYGPRFSTLDASSQRPEANQAALAGHPSAGYFRSAPPHGSTSLRVAFNGKVLARRQTDGTLLYRLEFRGQPGHRGDVLRLRVVPPPGWTWAGSPPPHRVSLYGKFSGEWVLRHKG